MALYTIPTNKPSDLRVIQGPKPRLYVAPYVTAFGAVPAVPTASCYAYVGALASDLSIDGGPEWADVASAEGYLAYGQRLVNEKFTMKAVLKECDPAVYVMLIAGSKITTNGTGTTTSIWGVNAYNNATVRTAAVGGCSAVNQSAVTARSRSANVAFLNFAAAHGVPIGTSIVVAGTGGTNYTGTKTVSAVASSTSLSYASTDANEANTNAVGGTVTWLGGSECTFYRVMAELPAPSQSGANNLRMQIEICKAQIIMAGDSKIGRDEATVYPIEIKAHWDYSVTPVAGTAGYLAKWSIAEA